MIKGIVFDFGDVFINLDKEGAMSNALNLFNLNHFEDDMLAINLAYEIGQISTKDFIGFYKHKFNYLTESKVVGAWNYILKDFPKYRLEFLKQLRQNHNYKLVLLSNTNELHIDAVKKNVPFYEEFKSCFHAFYLSHEINLRKPNKDIFNFVLKENELKAEDCLFIDDTAENTKSAQEIGFNIWNINEKVEDVVELFEIKKDLF